MSKELLSGVVGLLLIGIAGLLVAVSQPDPGQVCLANQNALHDLQKAGEACHADDKCIIAKTDFDALLRAMRAVDASCPK